MLKVVSKSALFGHNRVHRIFYRFTLSMLAPTLFFGGLKWTNSAVQAAYADGAGFKFVGRSNPANAEFTPTSLDTTTNTFTLSGVDTFSDGSLGGIMPVDGNTHVAGRALAGDRGISNAVVTLTDVYGYPRPVRTNQYGEFRFENVRVGLTYIVSIRAKGYGFSPETMAVTVNEEIEGLIFRAQNR